MCAARKKTEAVEIETVDLISLLTIPGQDGMFEAEIALLEPCEEIEMEQSAVQASATTSSAFSSGRPDSLHAKKPAEKAKPVDHSLDTLSAIMKRAPALPGINSRYSSPPGDETPISDDSFEKIVSEIARCEKCELCKTRRFTVPGVGNPNARLVFIGEAPGADEDACGTPFVGRAGQHLDKILKAAGFEREKVFICNILKCRPPENRNPTLEEMHHCTPFLRRQLNLIKPSLIACLGNVAIRFVIGADTPGVTKIHGEWFNSIFGLPVMAMYHPSYLVRSGSRERGSPNWQMWQDIQKLKKRYDESAG